MKVVVAPDSFKECVSARTVCEAVREGVLAVAPEANVVLVPMADGGDGTLEVVLANRDGRRLSREVRGPMGETVEASFGLVGETAIIEAAAANGIDLVPQEARNPLVATSHGVGELLLAAIEAGAERIVMTIGGSVTVDGGMGMARALGYRFLDADGEELVEGGGSLRELARIEAPEERPWESVAIEVACDVDNPLTGEDGAARVFGPQKGATPEMVEQLEAGLATLAEVLRQDLDMDVESTPGAGAAGGLGAGLMAFTGGELKPGIDLVMELVQLRRELAGADLVITGEGKTDGQTFRGKVCAGVARASREAGAPCVVLSGAMSAQIGELAELGVTAAFSVSPGPRSLAEAMEAAADDLREAAANVVRLFLAGSAAGDL